LIFAGMAVPDQAKFTEALKTIRAAIDHQIELRQERIEKTLDAVAGQLHGLVYGVVVDGLTMIQDKGKVHPRWVDRVKTLVDQVRVLNFTEDEELQRVCGELERLAEDGAASPASASRLRESLVQVGISLKADLVRQARRIARPDLFNARPGGWRLVQQEEGGRAYIPLTARIYETISTSTLDRHRTRQKSGIGSTEQFPVHHQNAAASRAASRSTGGAARG
jgi:hypothetical protein